MAYRALVRTFLLALTLNCCSSAEGETTVSSSNIALQKGAKAVELELQLNRDVDCSSALLKELSQLIVVAVRRTSKDLLHLYCTLASVRIQCLNPLQPVQGLRDSEEVALELLRQYKSPTSTLRSNATYIDYSFTVAPIAVFSCSGTSVAFQPSCGPAWVSVAPTSTWLGLEPYAPVTYIIFTGVCLLLCVLCIVIALCIRRSRKPPNIPKKVDVLTWKASDPPAGTSSVTHTLSKQAPLASPTDSSFKPALRTPSTLTQEVPGSRKKNPSKPHRVRPKLQQPLLIDPLTPSTPIVPSPEPIGERKAKKQLPEQIFLTHTPATSSRQHIKYGTSSPPRPSTFHFHPDKLDTVTLDQPRLIAVARSNRTPDFSSPPQTYYLRKAGQRRASQEAFDLAQPLEHEPTPKYPTPAWK